MLCFWSAWSFPHDLIFWVKDPILENSPFQGIWSDLLAAWVSLGTRAWPEIWVFPEQKEMICSPHSGAGRHLCSAVLVLRLSTCFLWRRYCYHVHMTGNWWDVIKQWSWDSDSDRRDPGPALKTLELKQRPRGPCWELPSAAPWWDLD